MKKIEQLNLFGSKRLEFNEQIQLTCDSLNLHGPKHDHWAIAWSMGKDSTAAGSCQSGIKYRFTIPRYKRY